MEQWNGIDKIKQQLAEARKEELEAPKGIEEVKELCDIYAEQIKETQRQLALESEYTKVTRSLYLKLGELEEAIKTIGNCWNKKAKKNIDEYNKIYTELLEITKQQGRLYTEISQYRTITPEQQEKGFL